MSPTKGTKDNLVHIDGGVMSELKYNSIKALQDIGNKIRTDAVRLIKKTIRTTLST